MQAYFRAIGFSRMESRHDGSKLIDQLMKSDNIEKLEKRLNSDLRDIEYKAYCGKRIGVTIRGEYDKDNVFHLSYYYPFIDSTVVSVEDTIIVNQRSDTEAYTGMCEDYRLGISLIFYLQNSLTYMCCNKKKNEEKALKVRLVGLSLEGKIILPTEKMEMSVVNRNSEQDNRLKLIEEARKGNQEAMESLTADELDLYSMVNKRIRTEDIYSIVDTTFIPYGAESDNYTILGIIEDIEYTKNTLTDEIVCIMKLMCNNIEFNVCINKLDLLGEPVIGRRFRGNIWMQGKADFIM